MMNLKNKTGLTLVEALVSMCLIGTLLVGILGAFFISRLGTDRARHRVVAMNQVKEYMEQEIRAGYLGGRVDGDFYVTFASSATKPITIDDRGTVSEADDLKGTIRPSPYPGTTLTYGSVRYKVIGFIAQWNEQVFQSGATRTVTERAATYVAERS